MKKELELFKNFWSDIPSIFDKKSFIFPSLSKDFEKILNGKCDFEELEDSYNIDIELPGIKKDEISIELKNDVLKISWKRIKENKKEKLKESNYERSEGSFSRSFQVEGADQEKINASLKDGILKIILPKNKEAKTKKIEIK